MAVIKKRTHVAEKKNSFRTAGLVVYADNDGRLGLPTSSGKMACSSHDPVGLPDDSVQVYVQVEQRPLFYLPFVNVSSGLVKSHVMTWYR